MKSMITLLLVMACSISVFAQNAQKQGDKLPNIVLTDLNGQKVDLSSYSENGKITVISFWATWCTPCKKELNNIAELYADWQEDFNAEVVAISIDDARNRAKVKPYVDGVGWEYDVLLDVNGDTKRAFSYQSVPFTVVVNKDGEIVDMHTGYVEGNEYLLEEKLEKLSKE